MFSKTKPAASDKVAAANALFADAKANLEAAISLHDDDILDREATIEEHHEEVRSHYDAIDAATKERGRCIAVALKLSELVV